jgi:hypothetical protein
MPHARDKSTLVTAPTSFSISTRDSDELLDIIVHLTHAPASVVLTSIIVGATLVGIVFLVARAIDFLTALRTLDRLYPSNTLVP